MGGVGISQLSDLGSSNDPVLNHRELPSERNRQQIQDLELDGRAPIRLNTLDPESRVFEQLANRVQRIESQVGLVENPFRLILETIEDHLEQHGDVGHVRHAHDQTSILGHPSLELLERRPWIDEVFEDVRTDDEVEGGRLERIGREILDVT